MAVGRAPLLEVPSPLFSFVSNRTFLLAAAAIESAVAALMLGTYRRRQVAAATAAAWLATSFGCYRLALWGTGFHGYCGCLGSLPALTHLSEKDADLIALGIVSYVLVGSYGILLNLAVSAPAEG
jgi:hypothetical protein